MSKPEILIPLMAAAELHEVLSVDPANEEEAKQKVAKFRDQANKCAVAVAVAV